MKKGKNGKLRIIPLGGLEKIGASVIPMSSGNTNKQIMFLQDMGVTLLVATPSYALHLGEELRSRGI